MSAAELPFALPYGLHFLRPMWLLALPALWWIGWQLGRRAASDGAWARLIDADLLPSLTLDERQSGGFSPWPWITLAWTLATIALAGPAWDKQTGPAFQRSAATVLVLDLSPSMDARDLSPDRVSRARYALDDLLGGIGDGRVGLVAFGAEAYTVAPLTHDVATVRALLPPLVPDILPTAGDALTPALHEAERLLQGSPPTEARIVVVSDGVADPDEAADVARSLRARGMRISVLGIGSANSDGSPFTRFQPGPLQSLADAGGGRYSGLDDLGRFAASLSGSGAAQGGSRQADDVALSVWRDSGYWLVPLLLVLGTLLARRGWL